MVGAAVFSLLEQLRSDDDIVSAMRAGSRLLGLVSTPSGLPVNVSEQLGTAIDREFDGADALYRSFAARILSRLPGPIFERRALALLHSTDALDRQSAAWAAAGFLTPTMFPGLLSMLSGDGIDRMLAQFAFLSDGAPPNTRAAALKVLLQASVNRDLTTETRVSAVDCLARLPLGARTRGGLQRLATDPANHESVRAAAVGALGDMRDRAAVEVIARLAASSHSGPVQVAAVEALGLVGGESARSLLERLAAECSLSGDRQQTQLRSIVDVALSTLDIQRASPPKRGLHVAQVSMRGTIDEQLRHVGEADGGGLATLLVQLGRELGRQPEIEQVYTVTRSHPDRGDSSLDGPLEAPIDTASRLVRISFDADTGGPHMDSWGSMLRIERGMRLFFASVRSLDAIHLRFADAGTWAAAQWARSAGVPIHFTLAPDPYVPIRSLQATGALSRQSFPAAEGREHYLYRAHVLDWMIRHAAGLALLPRPDWNHDAPTYFDLAPPPSRPSGVGARVRIIAEGIDVTPHRHEPVRIGAGGWRSTLRSHFARHPERRIKPVLVTVGRLHEIKGTSRLVEAWAADTALRAEFNLLIVGGNLQSPSEGERRVLSQVRAVTRQHPAASAGVILLGALPNVEVADLLAAARTGVANLLAENGIYVCASDKEEFGLAILEAMNAQLQVVAPREGGPPTYISHGESGWLANTRDILDLRSAIHEAAHVRGDDRKREAIVRRARAIVREEYSIHRMARELVGLYEAFTPASRMSEVAS